MLFIYIFAKAGVPSKTSIIRHRFTLDAVLAKMTMAKTMSMLSQGLCGTLLCDSSPRNGREWMFTELFLVLNKNVPLLLKSVKQLWRMGMDRSQRFETYRSQGLALDDLDVEERARIKDEEDKIVKLGLEMQNYIWHHTCPPALMGAKNLSLAAKFQTVLHCLRIEGFDWAHVDLLLQQLSGICTDYGTEAKIQTVPAFSANLVSLMWNEVDIDPKDWLTGRRLLSKMDLDEEFGNWCDDDTDSEVDTEPGMPDLSEEVAIDHFVPPETRLSFESSIRVPGIEHLTQNVLEASCKRLPGFDEWLKVASQVGKFFHGKYYINMLEETNFKPPEAAWVLKKLKSNEFCVPYPKRFGSVVQFLMVWVEIRFEVQKFYNPQKWTTSAEQPKDDSDDDWVDISKVTDAIMGEDFNAKAVMIFASNQPVEEVRLFSRGCPCHRNSFMAQLSSADEDTAFGAEEDSISTYRRRMTRIRKQAGISHPCAAKGLVLPFFAAGDHEDIMGMSRGYMRKLLWHDLRAISAPVRDANMSAFDKCTDHIVYNVNIKMSDFMVLPLRLAGVHHPMASKAAACAQAALSLWDRSSSKRTLHHQRTLALFDDEVAVQELTSVATSHADVDEQHALNNHIGRIAILKANELSAERLHHLGKMSSDHAGHVGPVHVSWALRGSEFNDVVSNPAKLAEAAELAEQLRNPATLVRAFQMSNNHVLALQRDLHLAKGGKQDTSRACSFKVVRDVFYRCDLSTLFNRNYSLQEHIYEAAIAKRAEAESHLADPLAFAKGPESTDIEKTEGFFCNYQFKHLKSVANEDRIYALPREALPMLEDLNEVAMAAVRPEAPVFGPQASSQMLEDVALDAAIDEPKAKAPMICFRIVHLKPKNQKSTNTATDLRNDHVAIRMYELRDKDWNQHSLTISSTMERDGSDDSVKLLSLSAFAKLGWTKMANSFVECECLQELTYFFQGVDMPPVCHGSGGRAVVTSMINAGAYPGIGATFSLVDIPDDEKTAFNLQFEDALYRFEAKGLVKRVRTNTFQISESGFEFVRKALLCNVYTYTHLAHTCVMYTHTFLYTHT